MAINKGWDGGIWVSTAGYAADTLAFAGGKQIVHINNWEVAFNNDALENTVFGDTVYDRTYQPGLRSHTLSFAGYMEASDSGQKILLDEQAVGDEPSLIWVTALTERTAGARAGWCGEGVVTGITVGTPVDGLSPISGNVQISGGLATFAT